MKTGSTEKSNYSENLNFRRCCQQTLKRNKKQTKYVFQHLMTHFKEEFASNYGLYFNDNECTKCNGKIVPKGFKNRHLLYSHGVLKKEMTKKYETLKSAKGRIKKRKENSKGEISKLYKCKECKDEKSFNSQKSLSLHKKSKHMAELFATFIEESKTNNTEIEIKTADDDKESNASEKIRGMCFYKGCKTSWEENTKNRKYLVKNHLLLHFKDEMEPFVKQSFIDGKCQKCGVEIHKNSSSEKSRHLFHKHDILRSKVDSIYNSTFNLVANDNGSEKDESLQNLKNKMSEKSNEEPKSPKDKFEKIHYVTENSDTTDDLIESLLDSDDEDDAEINCSEDSHGNMPTGLTNSDDLTDIQQRLQEQMDCESDSSDEDADNKKDDAELVKVKREPEDEKSMTKSGKDSNDALDLLSAALDALEEQTKN